MTDYLPARIDDLPASLVDVAETLGLRVAQGLIEHFGGMEMRVPVAPRADHPIMKALGEDDGRALCHLLGAQRIYIPHARPPRSALPEVRRLSAQGMGVVEIARSLGLSQPYVRRLLNSTEDKRQLKLFD